MKFWVVITFLNVIWATTIYYSTDTYFGFNIIGYLIYRFYTLYVVKAYIQEIVDDSEASKLCRNLTDEEIKEFENGLKKPDLIISVDIKSTSNSWKSNDVQIPTEAAQYERYKRQDFEIPKDELKIGNILEFYLIINLFLI